MLRTRLAATTNPSRRSGPASFWLAACALALLLAFGGPVAAESQPGQANPGFELIDDYILVVDGADDAGASIYAAHGSRAILLRSSSLEAPVLLWPRTRAVESIHILKMVKKGSDHVDLLPDPVLARHAPFQVLGSNVVFQVAGKELRLKPKPPLLGLFDLSSMFDSSKIYSRRAEVYQPSADMVEKLRTSDAEIRVRVFFGSWCPACGQMVPRIMRLGQELEDAGLDLEFYGLARGFSGEPEAERYNIKSVPTGVIFVDGREVGRLSGNDWRSPETALERFAAGR